MANGPGIGSDKLAALRALLSTAGIAEADLEEKFIRASGPGGQHVNKTSSAVWLRHRPSGHEVKVQSSRSQAHNRYLARARLARSILDEREGAHSEAEAARAKIRRQKRRRSVRAKQKVLADKAHQGAQKRARRTPRRDGDD